jgi:diguanylate cyclase (GGDEF)-like protein
VSNVTTLLAIVVFTPALAGGLLLLSWLQHPRQRAFCVWGSGFITASVAAALILIGRGAVPNFWSIIVGNALFAGAYGILWCGARTFEGKKVSLPKASLGALIWLVACTIPPVYMRPEARASVMAAICICYTLLAALELWRGRGDGAWRYPIVVLLLGHAAFIPLRIPIAGVWRHPDPFDADLITFVFFEAVFVSICAVYLLGGLIKDRVIESFRQDSLTDPLTGVMNRRGLFQIGERLLTRARVNGHSAALIMLDLDRFKDINDQFGHANGDEVLIWFCRLAGMQLRPNDLFGRIGGEEFVSLLPNATSQDALRLAERIRAAVEAGSHPMGAHTVRVTVSIGIAFSDDAATDLMRLLQMADEALYRAKATGRNRVEAWSTHAKQTLSRRDKLSAA